MFELFLIVLLSAVVVLGSPKKDSAYAKRQVAPALHN